MTPQPIIASFHVAAAAAADGWVHLLPAGVFRGRDGRGPYRLDDAEQVIAATRALGMDLPIDRDHATDLAAKGTPVPAAGWIRELQAREDGLWGLVEWTPAAAAQIEAREYRYLSPVFEHRKGTREVTRLLRASLTNNPNLHLTAIACAEGPMDPEIFARIRAELGLGAEADGAAVLTALSAALAEGAEAAAAVAEIGKALGCAAGTTDAVIAAAQRRAEPDPGRFVPLAQFQDLARSHDELKARLAAEDAERVLAAAVADGKVTPAMAEWARTYATKDIDGFRAWAKAAPALAGSVAGKARPPAGGDGLDDDERAICAALGLKPADYLAARKQETH